MFRTCSIGDSSWWTSTKHFKGRQRSVSFPNLSLDGQQFNQTGVLQYHDMVFKPLEQGLRAEKELKFYETVFANGGDPILVKVHDFLPKFHGTVKFHHEGVLTNILFQTTIHSFFV
jgi:hypothetical protein